MGISHRNEIGYQFHPLTWGKGYATEALRTFVKHVFNVTAPLVPPFDELRALVSPENSGSARVLVKCGFVQRRSGYDDVDDDVAGGGHVNEQGRRSRSNSSSLTDEQLQELQASVASMGLDLRAGEIPARPPVTLRAKTDRKFLVFVIRRKDFLARDD